MKRTIQKCFLFFVCLALFGGCDKLWPDIYWRSERYVLLAIDAKSQMSLYFDLNNGSAIGLVEPTVFSIGADQRYIVVKQHPSKDQFTGSIDRSITNYFVIERNLGPSFSEREKGVRGPLKKGEFDRLATSLSLPPFTKTFRDLQ
jgi:hypothetical protein